MYNFVKLVVKMLGGNSLFFFFLGLPFVNIRQTRWPHDCSVIVTDELHADKGNTFEQASLTLQFIALQVLVVTYPCSYK